MELTRIESAQTHAPIVVNRRLDDAEETTKDDQTRREVSASGPVSTDDAIRLAAKLAVDADDLDRARALLDLLELKPRSASVLPVAANVPAPKRDRTIKWEDASSEFDRPLRPRSVLTSRRAIRWP